MVLNLYPKDKFVALSASITSVLSERLMLMREPRCHVCRLFCLKEARTKKTFYIK
jgi:hypothetical protein